MAAEHVNVVIKARDQASKQVKGVSKSFAGLGKTLIRTGGALAGFFAARKLVSGFNSTREALDKLAKRSTQLDVSIASLAGFGLAAELSGTNVETLDKAMLRLTRNVGEQTPLATTTRALDQLGLSIEDLRQQSPDQMMIAVAESISQIDDPATRASAAFGVLGRSGQEMMSFLMMGGAALDANVVKAQKMGLAISQVDAAKVEKFNDALTVIQGHLTGVGRSIVVNLIDFIDDAKAAWAALPEMWTVIKDSAILSMVSTFEFFKHTFTVKIPAWLDWFKDNWKNIFTNLWESTKAIFNNMGKNIADFFQATWGFLKGDGFNFEWTGLLEGFESTLAQLPDIAARHLTGLEKQLIDRLKKSGGLFAEKFSGDPQGRLPGVNGFNPSDPSLAGGGGGSSGPPKLAARESRFLSFAPGQKDPAVATEKNTARMTKILDKIEKNTARGQNPWAGGNPGQGLTVSAIA